jgi:hypothetical protein
MKRAPPANKFKISRTFPLIFWKTCENCKHLFVRESMWYSLDANIYRQYHIGLHRYLCLDCAPTYEDAELLVSKFGTPPPNSRPRSPPPPPPPRSSRSP